MRIGDNLEVRFSKSGKCFQIVATGGKRDWAFCSMTRDIADQILTDEQTLKNLIEAYNKVRDSLATSETIRNDFIADNQSAKIYRATPNSVSPKIENKKDNTQDILKMLRMPIAV
jgi:hypothetical protein